MFATQHYMDAVDAGRKRLRDDEEAVHAAAAGFGEHRNKRVQSLPLRNSPRPTHHSQSPSIVPLNASPASAGPHNYPQEEAAPEQDAEMEMMDTAIAHPATPCDLSSERMPTPIQPSFAAQVRSQHGGWAPADQPESTPNGIANLGHHVVGISQDQTVPRAMRGGAEWQILQNHRRLPSPISEMGDPNMQNGGIDSPGAMMMDEQDLSLQPCQSGSGHDSMAGQPSPMHAMEHPNAMMDADCHHALAQHGEIDGDPLSTSPNRKGHQRSKHTVNSWTWQPGMKKSFSIGYRSDCEKCRLKVPGHFNHIVIS